MLRPIVMLHTASIVRRADDRGQATAEYALVLLGAATIAFLFIAWATGSGKIGELLDTVFERVSSFVK